METFKDVVKQIKKSEKCIDKVLKAGRLKRNEKTMDKESLVIFLNYFLATLSIVLGFGLAYMIVYFMGTAGR